MNQLMMLKQLQAEYPGFVLTEKTAYAPPKLQGKPTYQLLQVNRHQKTLPLRLLFNIWKSFRIFWKEKPDVVISTGVMACIPMCLIAKLFRRKLIFIESFAMVNSRTMTGRFLYRFADRFYVQWEPMKELYPKAIYLGEGLF